MMSGGGWGWEKVRVAAERLFGRGVWWTKKAMTGSCDSSGGGVMSTELGKHFGGKTSRNCCWVRRGGVDKRDKTRMTLGFGLSNWVNVDVIYRNAEDQVGFRGEVIKLSILDWW